MLVLAQLRKYASNTFRRGLNCDLSRRYRELGYEQFEVFQSVVNPDKLALLERWTDQAALDAHARLYSTFPPFKPELRAGPTEREDYAYNLTR